MKLWKWQKGRQKGTEYMKFPLWYFRILRWGFDAYILNYEADTLLKLHKDPVEGGKHWRFNIRLKGYAEFFMERKGITSKRFVLFRPDLYLHSAYNYTKVIKLSFGFVKFDKWK